MSPLLCPLLALIGAAQGLVLGPVPAAASVSRVAAVEMGAKKVAKKVTKKSSSTEGKGGIFPWITNEPGTYTPLPKLSSYDFTGSDGDKWIGWGFMPNSVKSLYKGKTRK